MDSLGGRSTAQPSQSDMAADTYGSHGSNVPNPLHQQLHHQSTVNLQQQQEPVSVQMVPIILPGNNYNYQPNYQSVVGNSNIPATAITQQPIYVTTAQGLQQVQFNNNQQQQFSQQQYIQDYLQRNAALQYQQQYHMQNTMGARPLRDWSSSLCSCQCNNEISWWSFWCCWLVGARTTESFELGTSCRSISYFWAFITCLLLSLFLGLFGFISVAIFGTLCLAYFRAGIRKQIREKLGIQGEFCDDLMLSCCCPCCATCQESHEAKFTNVKNIEFCCGEELLPLEAAHQQITTSDPENPAGSFTAHASIISKTSKFILGLYGIVALIVIMLSLSAQLYTNIIVLFLIFLQPFLIIYFVYWRPRRQHASLDSVIKMFAVGFWITVFQSIVLEIVLQFAFMLILYPFMNDIPAIPTDDVILDDGGQNNSTTILSFSNAHNSLFTATNVGIYSLTNVAPFSIKATIKKYIFDCMNTMFRTPETKLLWNDPYFPDVTSSHTPPFTSFGMEAAPDPNKMKKYFGIIFFAMFLNAFVVAAGVEETMKHFAFRCCRFSKEKIDNPHQILVYLMVGAIGFATAENIEYVFSSSSFITQIFILVMRVLMPVHVICSVIQAANTAKSAMGIQEMGTFRAILPAILLHGLFDFILFLLPYVEYIYQVDQTTIIVATISTVVSIVVFGICYACYSFGKVKQVYDNNLNDAIASYNGAMYSTVGNSGSEHGNSSSSGSSPNDNEVVTIHLTNNLP